MAQGAKAQIGHPIFSIRISNELAKRINAVAAEAGIGFSAAVRLLVSKGLGDQVEAAILREKVNAVNAIMRRNQHEILTRLRQEMLTMVNQIAPAPTPREPEMPLTESLEPLSGARPKIVSLEGARGRGKRAA